MLPIRNNSSSLSPLSSRDSSLYYIIEIFFFILIELFIIFFVYIFAKYYIILKYYLNFNHQYKRYRQMVIKVKKH